MAVAAIVAEVHVHRQLPQLLHQALHEAAGLHQVLFSKVHPQAAHQVVVEHQVEALLPGAVRVQVQAVEERGSL